MRIRTKEQYKAKQYFLGFARKLAGRVVNALFPAANSERNTCDSSSRKIMFRVTGCSHRGIYEAKNPCAAVHQFVREFHISRCKALRSDPETGGWQGISVSPL